MLKIKHSAGAAFLIGLIIAVVQAPSKTDNVATLEATNDSSDTHISLTLEGIDSSADSRLPENIKDRAKQLECYEACLTRLFDSLLSNKELAPEEMELITGNPDYLAHFLNFNPDIIAKVGSYIMTANIGEEGTENYNEAIDARVMLLDDILHQLPVSQLEMAARSMVNSSDLTIRRNSFALIERGYVAIFNEQELRDVLSDKEGQIEVENNPDLDISKATDDFERLLSRYLYSETSPEKQIEAIDLLARKSTNDLPAHAISILSGISVNTADTKMRGKAMELAAYATKSDSLILTQISDELANLSSDLHKSALNALYTSLRRAPEDDTELTARLSEFEPYLHKLTKNPAVDPDTARYAESIIKGFYKKPN